jgi:hypothetical protein
MTFLRHEYFSRKKSNVLDASSLVMEPVVIMDLFFGSGWVFVNAYFCVTMLLIIRQFNSFLYNHCPKIHSLDFFIPNESRGEFL